MGWERIESNRRVWLGVAGAIALSLSTSSCVTRQRYDELADMARYYQSTAQEAQRWSAELESELRTLRDEAALLDQPGTTEAGAFIDPIDERMEELRRLMKEVGRGSTNLEGVTPLQVEGGYGYSLGDAVIFDTGSTEIRSSGKAVLEGLASQIRQGSYQRIWIRGHSDNVPIVRAESLKKFPFGNLQLSALRAVVVADYLKTKGGIDSTRIVIAGFGPNEPIAPNDTSEHRQQNRRVEIFVLEDPSVGTAPLPSGSGN